MMACLLKMLKNSLKHGPSLKYIAFCPYYIMPSLPFRASLENQGVKSCTNDQFTETGIHSKPRAHVLDTFFFSRVLENLPWERRLKEGDLRSVESKQRVHRTFFFKKLICQKLLYLNHNVTAPGTPAMLRARVFPRFLCCAEQDS